MYAIIKTGGKQYRVQSGDIIFVEKINAQPGETVVFDKVIAVRDENGLKVGKPYVDGATVKATLIKNGKGKKITVFTYKPKSGYSRKLGHRQPYSKVQIDSIGE